MISLDSDTLQKIKNLLSASIENAAFYAYGSRVTGSSGQTSDLDVMVKAHDGRKLTAMELGEATDIISASNIPFSVDIHDYYSTDPFFLSLIKNDLVEI